MLLLKQSALFNKISPEESKVLLPLAHKETFTTGSIIFSQGSRAEKIYLLDYGNIALKTAFSDGLEITYEIITRKGEAFGLSALVAPFRFTTTAICLEKTEAMAFPQKDLMKALSYHSLLGFKVMQNLCILLARRLERTRRLLAGQV
jgi:CRP/FNR family transcriptional regulator, cyclic AMP receptor protein